MITLAIDASTYRGTVAVLRDRKVVAAAESAMRGVHAEALMPSVASVLAEAGVAVVGVGRVICGEGPGSFTSLRIAAGIAKGICLGRGIPLFAVSSLGLAVAATERAAGSYVASLDALRDEWYAALFTVDTAGKVSQQSPVALVGRTDIERYAETMGGILVGAASASGEPHASGCLAMLEEVEQRGPVDLERWEPSYGRLAEAQVKWEATHGRALRA